MLLRSKISLFILSLGLLGGIAQAQCMNAEVPTSFMAIGGEDLQLFAETSQAVDEWQRYLGECRLGNGTETTIPAGQLNNCLLNAYANNGQSAFYPAGINYVGVKGSCEINGSADLDFQVDAPLIALPGACNLPLQGTMPIALQTNGDELDYPMEVTLDGVIGGTSYPLGNWNFTEPYNATVDIDTTTLPDSDDLLLRLTGPDNSESVLDPCIVDNNPPVFPGKTLEIYQGENLTVNLGAASDDGAGIQEFQFFYDGEHLSTAPGNANEKTLLRTDLEDAGVDACSPEGLNFPDMEVIVTDNIGQQTITDFDILVFCRVDTETNESDTENEEDENGGGAGSSSRTTTVVTTQEDSSGTDERTGSRKLTFFPAPRINFDGSASNRIVSYIDHCRELPHICPNDIPGTPVDAFPDMFQHWSAGYVDAFRASCGVKGKGDTGNFFPDDPVTYGEAVKMATTTVPFNNVYNWGGETDYSGPTYFPDVPVEEWSAPYWANAWTNGRLDGIAYENQNANPYTPMPRSKAIRLLVNIFVDVSKVDLANFDADVFADVPVNHPDAQHIAAAYELNVVQGNLIEGQRYFKPDAGVTRAEFAKMATQLFTSYYNRCGVSSNLDWLQKLADQWTDKTTEQQEEELNNTRKQISNSSAQDLENQGLAQAGLVQTFYSVTRNEVNDLLNEADDTLAWLGAIAEDGPCPPDLIARLNAMKASLEAQVTELEGTVAETINKRDTLKGEIDQLKKDIKEQEQKAKDKQKEIDDRQKEIDDLQKEIDDASDDIDEKRERVAELQNILANGDDVTIHQGDAPLADINAGAAVTFDGGATWVVAHGEGGVESLLDAMDGGNNIMDELRDLKKEISDLTKKKEEAEKKKEDKEQENEDAQDELDEMNKKLTEANNDLKAKETEMQECTNLLKELSQQIAALNARIAAFNALAERCGIRARSAYDATRRMLENMPPEDREAAEEQYEESLTEDEETATENPSEDVAGGGQGLSGATSKLRDAMVAASNCPPPQTKTGPWSRKEGSYKSAKIRGAESVELTNARGSRGLDDDTMEEIFNGILAGLNYVDAADKTMGVFELLTDYNPVSLIYNIFQDAAQEAIVKKLKEWMDNRRMQGLPERIEVSIGPIWSIIVSGWEEEQPVYNCVDNIWQYSHSNLAVIENVGECTEEGGPYTFRKTWQTAELNLRGCDRGNCPQAWEDAIKGTIDAAMKRHADGGIIGSCEEVADKLSE